MDGLGRGYRLRCCGCGAEYEDDGVQLDCTRPHAPALLRTEYAERAFGAGSEASATRYGAWLPRGRELAASASTAIYRSRGLGAYLGLRSLWIAFNGWWPERGATMTTGSFKDLEAPAVFARMAPDERRTLVIASAGNTAAAFAAVASAYDLPIVIVIPLDAWAALAGLVRIGPSVRTIAIAGGTYQDAIGLANGLAARDGYVAEGGVRNVARRDGMGTTMLAAVETIGRLPDAYVQAVGSAAGALAAHEAALRVVADGRYGHRLPRLLLSQNAPFTPIHDAWERRAETLDGVAEAGGRERQMLIAASVLANPSPPYATAGGVREALAASDGRTYAIGNHELANAMTLFAEVEGIDVEPAAGVAIASLIRAARSGDIGRDDVVLANVTGGGRRRIAPVTTPQRPSLVVPRGALRAADDEVAALSA